MTTQEETLTHDAETDEVGALAEKASALPYGWQRKVSNATGIYNTRISDILSKRITCDNDQFQKLKTAIDALAAKTIIILSKP